VNLDRTLARRTMRRDFCRREHASISGPRREILRRAAAAAIANEIRASPAARVRLGKPGAGGRAMSKNPGDPS